MGSPLRCTRCRWHLISRAEWDQLGPAAQGYALYMQGSWPTSELRDARNPYAKDTPAWKKFCEGEQRAAIEAQDGEE